MLRDCPLLETILVVNSHTHLQRITSDYSPVSLPNLHSIELGPRELHSELVTHLRFPPTVAAGFRSLDGLDVFGDNIPSGVMASSRHVLGGIIIHTIILAIAAPHPYDGSLVRFEGLDGSLEINFWFWFEREASALFGGRGGIFSFAPRLDNVKELQITLCYLDPMLDVDRLATVMPNLTSICFFHCTWHEGDNMFGLYPSGPHQTPPFPHLKHLTVLQPGPGLIQVARGRKKHGFPLQTVVIGHGTRVYTPKQIVELREFVDDVRVEIPPDISGWSTGNRILDVWSETGIPGLVSTT